MSKTVYSDGKRYIQFVKLLRSYKVGAEIGVWRGLFTRAICKYNPQIKLYAIDSWKDGMVNGRKMDFWYKDAVKRLSSYKCEIIRNNSMDVVKKFADGTLDFVYIDASHESKDVEDDIREWSRKVRKGGIVAGHDYYNGKYPDFDGSIRDYKIKDIVDKWVKDNNVETLYILRGDFAPTWYYVK